MRKSRPSLAVAFVALFVALGGTAVASHYVITSTSQIKPSVVKHLRGKAGPAGIAHVQYVQSAPASICAFGTDPCDVAQATAVCPSSSVAVGGAADATTIETSISTYANSSGYAAIADNASEFDGQLTATAICASGAGLHASSRSALAARVSRIAATLRSEH